MKVEIKPSFAFYPLINGKTIFSSKSLVIVIEVEHVLEDCPRVVFEGHFCNEDTKVEAWSQAQGIDH